MLSGNTKYTIFSGFQLYARARYVTLRPWEVLSWRYLFCLLFLKLKLINFLPAIEIKSKKIKTYSQISVSRDLISLATLPAESPSIFLNRSHEEERASADCLDCPRQFILHMLNLVPRLDQKARRFRVRDWNMLQIQTRNGAFQPHSNKRLRDSSKLSFKKVKKSWKKSLIYYYYYYYYLYYKSRKTISTYLQIYLETFENRVAWNLKSSQGHCRHSFKA